jgi:hypothetical protein
MSSSGDLLDRVVEASGLMGLIAPFTIRRLLIKADVTPQELTPAELHRALPQLEQGLGVYLDRDQLDQALSRLRRLASG